MDKLGVRERGQLKSLLAGETLPTDAQHSIINILRTDLPDFFSQLTSGLEKTKSADNSAVAKYLKLNTGKTRQILKKQKLAFLTQKEQDELGSALEKPLANEGVVYQQDQTGPAEQAPAGTTGGGIPNIGMPSGPAFSRGAPRIIHAVQHAPDSGLVAAHSSGAVVEQTKEFHVTDKAGNIQATYSREPAPVVAQSKLVVPGREAGDASKLVSARGNGSIIEPKPKNPTIHVANKSGNIIKTYNIKSPGWLKTLGSNSQIFAKQNFVRIGNGLKNMFGSAANLGGRTGLRAFNHGGNFLSNLSGGRSRLASGLKGAKSRVSSLGEAKKLGLGLGIFSMIFFVAALGGMLSDTSTGETAPNPTPGNSSGVNYTLLLRDKTIIPQDVKAEVLQSWPNAQVDSWQTIIDQAVAHNWNPAVLLTLWIEESGAQGAPQYSDPLGCGVGTPTTDIQVSLDCFFKNFDGKFTNDQFPQFLLTYSAPNDPVPFQSNPNFPINFKNWYSKLVPSGPGAIQLISAGGANGIYGCPAAGIISTPYGFNITDYPDVSNFGCGNLRQCHSGIDIASIDGALVKSPTAGTITAMSYDSLKGNYVEIQNSAGISVELEHLRDFASGISVNSSVIQGTVVGTVGQTGQVSGFTLHYRINKGSNTLNPFLYLGIIPSSGAKSSADDITQNDYNGITPSNNWGQCY